MHLDKQVMICFKNYILLLETDSIQINLIHKIWCYDKYHITHASDTDASVMPPTKWKSCDTNPWLCPDVRVNELSLVVQNNTLLYKTKKKDFNI